MARHFLTGEELSADELAGLIERARELKARRPAEGAGALSGRSVALVFEKPSTRTRISFEVGVAELGGTPVVLRGDELQLTRGESIGDTGRVLSRYVDAIAIRSGSHDAVAELARTSEVSVVNALTPEHHPCQAIADLMTMAERFGALEGLRLAYVGDGNNVARSLAILGGLAGVELVAGRGRDHDLDAELLARASDRAIALHCLPAHPGEEISEDVLYGERSAVWDQAENRLHAQKALLELLIA